MRTQRERDEQTIAIGMGLAVFAVVMALGGLAALVLWWVADVRAGEVWFACLLGMAGTLAVVRVARSN